MASSHRSPVRVFANFAAGGVPAGIAEGCAVRYIEKHTGYAISDLIDGVHASSAGTAIAVPLFSNHPTEENTPRFTGEEALQMFKENASIWLSRKIPYLRQHLMSLKLPFSHHAKDVIYFDEKLIESTLQHHLGDITLADLRGSFTISAHNASADSPEKVAIQFSKMIDINGQASFTPSPDIRVRDLMRGSMAVPGHFKSQKIDNVGNLCDFAHIYTADRALLRFQRNGSSDVPVHFIEFGSPRYHGLSADMADKSSLLSLILNSHLMRGTSNQSYSNAMQMITDIVGGEDFVHNLTPIIKPDMSPRIRKPSDNILDASQRNISLWQEYCEEDIQRHSDRFEKLADFLGNNKVLKDAPLPDMAPPQSPAIEKPHPGFFAGMRSLFFGAPQSGPVLH